MPDLNSAIREGSYAQKQIFSRDSLVAWSHGRRFHTALQLARDFQGRRVLDFGSGDGTFLAMLMMSSEAPAEGVGADLSAHAVEDCRVRYRAESRLSFAHVNQLDSAAHLHRYDAVFCMEVLEHVVDWAPVLARLSRLLARDGRLILSVPVEIGLPVVLKQTARRIAGWRGIGHYPGTTSYSWAELLSAVFAGPRQHVVRPVFDNPDGQTHDHKGFNWKVLLERLKETFQVDRVLSSPVPMLGPHLGTQVWFVARPRTPPAAARLRP
jgi:SAM-dependent methyltransferase